MAVQGLGLQGGWPGPLQVDWLSGTLKPMGPTWLAPCFCEIFLEYSHSLLFTYNLSCFCATKVQLTNYNGTHTAYKA